jgi:hypothetical protein
MFSSKKVICTRYKEEWIIGGGKGFIGISYATEYHDWIWIDWQYFKDKVIDSSYLARGQQEKPEVSFIFLFCLWMKIFLTLLEYCLYCVKLFYTIMLLSKWSTYNVRVLWRQKSFYFIGICYNTIHSFFEGVH